MARGSARRLVMVFVASAVLLGTATGAAISGPVGAATALPIVKASPSTKLVDHQLVTMNATGFTANVQVGTVECRPTAVTEVDCDLGTLVYTSADKNGAFTLKRYVRRLISVGGKKVDCAATAGCILGAGNISNLKQANGVKIFFDPKVPAKVPSISVSKRTGLADHELVTVSGRGYAPSTNVSISQCVTHPPNGLPGGNVCDYSTSRYIKVTATGTFTTPNFVLERRQPTFSKSVIRLIDCAAAAGTCEIRAVGGSVGSTKPPSVALTFDPKVPVVSPTVSLSPVTPLRDLDFVTLTGSGFTPGVAVGVQECVAAADPKLSTCDYTTSRSVSAGFQGEVQITLAVRRIITGFVAPSGITNVDCGAAQGTCQLRVQGSQSQVAKNVPLVFDPNLPPVARQVAASPDTNLVDNQEITVSLTGFTPNQTAQVVECSGEVVEENGDQSYCDYNTTQLVIPPGANTVQVPFHVRRTLGLQSGLVDCSAQPGACVLVATQGYSGGYAGIGRASTATTTVTTPPATPTPPIVVFANLSFSTP